MPADPHPSGFLTKYDIGIDDSGRGALGGVQVIAAVYAPEPKRLQWLGATDSKNTSPRQRHKFVIGIHKLAGAHVAVAAADAAWINQVGVDQAEALSVRSLVDEMALKLGVDHSRLRLWIDGKKNFPNLPVDVETRFIPRGDGYVPVIAAASMVASHQVDVQLAKLQPDYPEWPLVAGRAYSLPEHLQLLYDHGPCPWHYQKACRTAVTHYALKKGLPLPTWLRSSWKEVV